MERAGAGIPECLAHGLSARPMVGPVITVIPVQTIASPCVNLCSIDPADGYCEGCRRTLDEIARWTIMSDADRARVMAELPGR